MNVFINSKIADSYDAYYKTEAGKKVNRIEEDLIKAALQKMPGGKMLELGCGTGHWTKFFVERGFDVIATDVSEAMLKHALQKNLDAEIVQANAKNLPFNDESFDVVSSITMMEFVNNKDKVLEEINRVLKPNGYLLLACLNGVSQLGLNAANDPVFAKANFYTASELEEKLQEFGKPEIRSGVHFSPSFELMDATPEKENHEPAFFVGLVQKTN